MQQKADDIKALHDQQPAELQSQLNDLQKQLAQARLKREAGKLEDTASISRISDAIARVKTIMREKQLLEAAAKLTDQQAANKED